MNKMFALMYLNEIHPLTKNNGWQISTIYDHFPTVEEILDNSCLLSEDENDVLMARRLVETKGRPTRFIYENSDGFFECMIQALPYNTRLNLWDYFHIGYADNEKDQIKYKK